MTPWRYLADRQFAAESRVQTIVLGSNKCRSSSWPADSEGGSSGGNSGEVLDLTQIIQWDTWARLKIKIKNRKITARKNRKSGLKSIPKS